MRHGTSFTPARTASAHQREPRDCPRQDIPSQHAPLRRHAIRRCKWRRVFPPGHAAAAGRLRSAASACSSSTGSQRMRTRSLTPSVGQEVSLAFSRWRRRSRGRSPPSSQSGAPECGGCFTFRDRRRVLRAQITSTGELTQNSQVGRVPTPGQGCTCVWAGGRARLGIARPMPTASVCTECYSRQLAS